MRKPIICAVSCLLLAVTPSFAQSEDSLSDRIYLASAGQQGQPRNNAPAIGLRQRADYLVMQVSFSSDSRDFLVRKQEIHAMLLDALGKSKSAGIALATGNPVLTSVTRENYQNIAFQWAGREDTSKAEVMVSVPLSGTPAEAEKRVDAFVKSLTRTGRGSIIKALNRMLGVRDPDQYRAQIVQLIAKDARANAEVFGPDYRAQVDGIDKPVQWTQLNDTDVFLYLPYSYRIGAN